MSKKSLLIAYPVTDNYYVPSVSKSRFNLLRLNGIDDPRLYYVMKRKEPGQKAVTYSFFDGKEWHLAGNKSNNISKVIEPDINSPGDGYGDINGSEDAILTFRNIKTGNIRILVYPGWKKQKELLFQNRYNGGVSLSIPYNKLKLDTLSVMNP